MGRRRYLPPFEMEVDRLGPRGVGLGSGPGDLPVQVRGAPPGSRVLVTPAGRRKGVLNGRRTALIRPPAANATPKCAVFGLCGGCTLQELSHAAQSQAKHVMAMAEIRAAMPSGMPDDVVVHGVRGAPDTYGYRNRIEMSFGDARFVSEEHKLAGATLDGRFLGFHAPGRFDRVVDTDNCPLVADPVNEALLVVREYALSDTAPPPRNARTHIGFWRHVRFRCNVDGDVQVALYTASPQASEGDLVSKLATALLNHPMTTGRVKGVLWLLNDGVADVARGEVREVWGEATLTERLGGLQFRLAHDAFFQTSTPGAQVLYDTVREALGPPTQTLLDLYCGAGAIGLTLADGYGEVVGLEEVASAVEDAKNNALLNKISNASFQCTKVEDALGALDGAQSRHLVVDPPRAGLHPKVSKRLATAEGDVLVYVACKPGSLGRDAVVLQAGNWTLTDIWVVDLFPHTGHVEAVARFIRRPSMSASD